MAATSTLRIALAQTDPTVGDLDGNARQVLDWTAKAAEAGARLVAFGEMQLTGYPVEDLVFRESFVAASRARVDALAVELAEAGLGETVVVTGYVDADGPARMDADSDPDRGPRDALAVIHRGRVVTRYFKHHLPNYGVFDEDRYFVSGDVLQVVRIDGIDVAFTICEDIWQAGGPFAVARGAGVGLVVNINASPYERNKDDRRAALVKRRAAEADATVAFVNIVGGQDELVFDGDSLIVDAAGTVLTRGPQFAEHLLVHDLTLPVAGAKPAAETDAGPPEMTVAHTVVTTETLPAPAETADGGIAEPLSDLAEVWHALVTGLRDYVRKNGFRTVVFGLSGGIDSALVAALSADAIGPENVYAVSMPSRYSSEHSRDDAADLAKRTGINYLSEPIASIMDAYLGQITLDGLALENVQPRIRGLILMGLSNQHGHLVLAPGNKTEYATGYSTLYGDTVGGYAPIKDVMKLMIFALANWRNEEAARRGETMPIPVNTIVKPPSAELREDQQDTDSLPPYEILDPIVEGYVDGDLGRAGLIAAGHDAALVDRVIKLIDRAEYKRRQTAPGPKISVKNFGRDRRLPITNRWVEKA
ncbi:NAD+ synthase [Phytomonospora endophytica]|uniref:Glutamine-dependent NAD(+) synthetase n=1 Tax=Phytomonospora endophytica TaxID=714109 RepID=A0A841FID0_9ACTN|nr:NAD+ synthase [Phytomonospora endophytica]MBB6032409.1 NAD+ synthase (glutamine-hydrolyzing) [Phytomonospora endophytica]GIG71377.1 NAD+ synthase (glutamine-hydrolysing) [Phytomonospora endophytica]